MPGEQGDRSALPGVAPSGLPSGVTVISIHPMYSVGQICLATWLGGFVGGGWLMALNYKRLGAPGKARIAMVGGVLTIAAMIAIGFVAGRETIKLLLISPVPVVGPIAAWLQGAGYRRHVAVGGSRGSSWRAAGVGIASGVLSLAAIAGAFTAHQFATRPDKVMVGRASVFYAGGVSRAEAQRVGEELVALDDDRGDVGWGVEVTRDGGRPVIAFILPTRSLSDRDTQTALHELAEPLSREVYGGAPVDVWLIDGRFRPRVKLTWESLPR